MANTTADAAVDLGRWFARGQAIGRKPLYDGMCAFCAGWLYGTERSNHACSNKAPGVPVDIQENPLSIGGASERRAAQPPCLLRFSPKFYAQEAPHIFQHDAITNCLSLAEGREAPWLTPSHGRRKGCDKSWLYCGDCHKRLFHRSKTRRTIPFRDMASRVLAKVKVPISAAAQHQQDEAKQQQQSSPPVPQPPQPASEGAAPDDCMPPLADDGDAEPSEEENTDTSDDEGVGPAPASADGQGADKPDPYVPKPTTAEYEATWAAEKAKHSKTVPGKFSLKNLVPEPQPQYWQDAPHVKGFGALSSSTPGVQARLSTTRPYSGVTPPRVDPVPTFAHNTGDVEMHRQPSLAAFSTNAFIVDISDGSKLGATPEEAAGIHECFAWACSTTDGLPNNPILANNKIVFAKAREQLGALRARLGPPLPEGNPRVRVRMYGRDTKDLKQERGNLGQMLGEEHVGMVVLDDVGHPFKCLCQRMRVFAVHWPCEQGTIMFAFRFAFYGSCLRRPLSKHMVKSCMCSSCCKGLNTSTLRLSSICRQRGVSGRGRRTGFAICSSWGQQLWHAT